MILAIFYFLHVISQFSLTASNPIIEGDPVGKVVRKLSSKNQIKLATSHPFVVRLEVVDVVYDEKFGSQLKVFLCGGTIIRKGAILTAAHCLTSCLGKPEVLVYAGISDMDIEKGQGQKTAMRKKLIHKDYVDDDWENGMKVYQKHDIAIIWLEKSLEYNSKVNQAALIGSWGQMKNKKGYAFGWGQIEAGGQFPSLLRKGELTVISQKECMDYYRGVYFTDAMMCIISDDKKIIPCIGDSGGPFIINNKIAGIMSFNSKQDVRLKNDRIVETCNPKRPEVITHVGKYQQWIETNLMMEAKHKKG